MVSHHSSAGSSFPQHEIETLPLSKTDLVDVIKESFDEMVCDPFLRDPWIQTSLPSSGGRMGAKAGVPNPPGSWIETPSK
jgi:hypothetical protein